MVLGAKPASSPNAEYAYGTDWSGCNESPLGEITINVDNDIDDASAVLLTL